MPDVKSLAGRRCGRVAVLCAAVLAVSPASSRSLVETLAPEQIKEGVSALGLPPPEDWQSIRDWRSLSVRLDCGLETKTPSACEAADVARAPLVESAAETAMRWLRDEGLPSPSRLGPVVDPEIGGGKLLIFSRALTRGAAVTRRCRDNQGGFRGVSIHYGLPVARNDEGIPLDRLIQSKRKSQVLTGAILAHELTHAIQRSIQADTAGWERVCDPGGYSGRMKMLFEGLANFVMERFVREHRADGESLFIDRPEGNLPVNTLGLDDRMFMFLYGGGRFDRGLFDKSNHYHSSAFFRHLGERYQDGSVRLPRLWPFSPSVLVPGGRLRRGAVDG